MILPLVLSSHEEATVRCAKARPGSNSSTGSKAPVRLTTSGPHVLAKLSKLDPVFIDRCDARGVMQNSSHLINAHLVIHSWIVGYTEVIQKRRPGKRPLAHTASGWLSISLPVLCD